MLQFAAAKAALKGFVASASGMIFLAMLAAFLIQTVRIEGFKVWPIKIDGLKEKLADEREARRTDRTTYETAQADAKAKNLAEVRATEQRWEQNNAEQKSRYNRDLTRLRAGGVRQDLAAPRSPAGKPGASGPAAPACRDDEQNVCISRANLMRAAEIELGRNALIDWIEKQLAK